MKYYWVCYINKSNRFVQDSFNELVLEDVHPFARFKNDKIISIINWREISKEEYDLFNQ